jgi:hypothetical protein
MPSQFIIVYVLSGIFRIGELKFAGEVCADMEATEFVTCFLSLISSALNLAPWRSLGPSFHSVP